MIRKVFSILTAALMALSVLTPVLALPARGRDGDFSVPSGYSENDYLKLVAFLETTDGEGVKNGVKISPSYDPARPETWGFASTDYSYDPPRPIVQGVEWANVNGVKRAVGIIFSPDEVDWETGKPFPYAALFGELDISGFTALLGADLSFNFITSVDASGCTALENANFFENEMTGASFEGCTALSRLDLGYNDITELDLSGCRALVELNVGVNLLTELPLQDCPALVTLNAPQNRFTSVDVSACPGLMRLYVQNNRLEALELSHNPALTELCCFDCGLRELDVAACPALTVLDCRLNLLTELDLHMNPEICLDRLEAEGEGFIGFDYGKYEDGFVSAEVEAYRSAVSVFVGWYDPEGNAVSSDEGFGGCSELDPDENVIGPDPITALGVSGLTARFETMEHNAEEASRLRAFLELADENGVKNGEKLNDGYDPDNAATWTNARIEYDEETGESWEYRYGFIWNLADDGAAHLSDVLIDDLDMVGDLDLSGFAYLDGLYCGGNRLTSIDLDGCSCAIEAICPGNPELRSISLENCSWLYVIDVSSTALSEIDVSDCAELCSFEAVDTLITSFDFTHCPEMVLDRVAAEGAGGRTGLSYGCPYYCYLYAEPDAGWAFAGWYGANGELISSEPVFGGECEGDAWSPDFVPDPVSQTGVGEYYARFVPAEELTGDANGDGRVELLDALLVLRHAMGVIELPGEALARCDADGNGEIELTDSLLILRLALGIIDSF